MGGRWRVWAAAGVLCGLTGVAAATTNQTLFVIERSKNANVVHYDARMTAPGTLDPKEPATAYWVLLAQDGRREPLNLIERTKAYGFDIKPAPTGDCWIMTLVAYPQRPVTLRPTPGGVRAEIAIDGRPALFEKLFIHSTEGLMLPKVDYFEFHGKDLETGAARYEKLVPGHRDP